MITGQSAMSSPLGNICLMPMTMVFIDRVGGDQQRPEVLVPAVDEQDHEQRRDIRAAHRQQDVPEEPHRPCAVDARGFGQFVRHGHEELAEQEGRGGRGDQREDQAGIAVEHAEAGDDLVGRHDAHLDRQHQRQEDQPEEQLAARKPEIDDGEGRQQRDGDLAQRDAQRHDQANSAASSRPAR